MSADAISSQENLMVYPNPTLGKFTIESRNEFASDTRISLFDLLGKEYDVISKVADGNKIIEIDIASLKEGIYLIRVSSTENEQVLRVVKY